jgi:hypothetical protein
MRTIVQIRVFLASPGDVSDEREAARIVFENINHTLGDDKQVQFKVVGWDTDSIPAYGSDAQDLINKQIGAMEDYDLFIGIMWNRFGGSTPRAGSGTEEEFNRAVDSFQKSGAPWIMFYFNQAPFTPKDTAEVEQKLKVMQFKERVQKGGLTADYNGVTDLRSKLQTHIEKWLIQKFSVQSTPPTIQSEAVPSIATADNSEQIEDSGMWVLLKTGFFVANEVTEKGRNLVSINLPANNAQEDSFTRSLQGSHPGASDLIPFAHQNLGAIARVHNAVRRSQTRQGIWKLELELQKSDAGFMSEMGFNSLSPDQIAVMRARYILLNEVPRFPGTINAPRDQMQDMMLQSLVSGISTRVKIKGSILPKLWREFKGRGPAFLPLARLWSVFHLTTSNTVEYIQVLKLGPIRDDKLAVEFKGIRHRFYGNVEPFVIQFQGYCDLSASDKE